MLYLPKCLVIWFLLCLCVVPAWAKPPIVVRESAIETMALSPGAYARPSFLPEKGSTQLGADLMFVTARKSPVAGHVYFTDIGLLRPHVRISVHDRVQVAAEADLLVKEAQGDSGVAQNGRLKLTYGFGEHLAAHTEGAVGALYGKDGRWLDGAAGLYARHSLESFFLLEGFALGRMLQLSVNDSAGSSRASFAEASIGGKIASMSPSRFDYGGGGWIGAELSFPFAQRGDLAEVSFSATESLDLDPTMSVGLGGILRMRAWDFTLALTFVDRGDQSAPETTLPILRGGFDQVQMSLGLTRRFGHESNIGL